MSPNVQEAIPDERTLEALQQLGVRLSKPLLQANDRARLHEQVQRAIAQEDYEAALEDAWLLAYDAPWDRDGAIAFATCVQHLGDPEVAARHYAIALLLDERDAYCAYRIGECLGALDLLDEARDAFEAAVEMSWGTPAFQEVREHALQRIDELTGLGH